MGGKKKTTNNVSRQGRLQESLERESGGVVVLVCNSFYVFVL